MVNWISKSKKFSINLNFRTIILIQLYIFGFYGWGSPDLEKNKLFVIGSLLIVIATWLIIFFYQEMINLKHELNVTYSDGIKLILIMILLLILNWKHVNDFLTVDELAYSFNSQLHSYLIATRLVSKFELVFIDLSAFYTIQIVNIVILLFVIIIVKKLLKLRSDSHFLSFAVLLLIVMRGIIAYFGGNVSHHSPLQNIYYFLWTVILGPHNWTFRVATMFTFAVLSLFIYRLLATKIQSRVTRGLFVFLIMTIPILRNIALTMEIAIWTFIITVGFLVYMVTRKFIVTSGLLIPLSLFSYLRLNLIIVYIGTCVAYLIQNGFKVRLNSPFFVSIVVAFPGVFFHLYGRTNRSELSVYNWRQQFPTNVSNAFQSIVNSQAFGYVVGSILAVLLVMFFYQKAWTFLIAFIPLNVIVFGLMNNTELSYASKYVIEWGIAPLFLSSFFVVRLLPRFKISVTIILIVINIYGLVANQKVIEKFKEINLVSSGDFNKAYSTMPRLPFEYGSAFKFIAENQLQCLSAGPTYGSFPYVLGGFTLEDINKNRERNEAFLDAQSKFTENWLDVSSSSLELAGVKCVVIGAIMRPMEVKKKLADNGWFMVKDFVDPDYQTVVRIFIR